MVILLLVVLGLVAGSFVNALIWRVHERAKPKSKSKNTLTDKDLSILHGRSMCSKCHHPLATKDLIPVISWISLRGKCRYCHKPIEDSPLIEFGTALVFVVSYIYWPLNWGGIGTFSFVVWILALVGLMALFVYDIRWQLLPNVIIYPLLVGVAIATLWQVVFYDGGWPMLKDAGLSVLIGGGIFYALFEYSKGKWIGGGDVKLGALLGLLVLEPAQAFLVLFTSSLLGTAFILPGLLTKKLNKKSKIPFGPFLIVAGILVKLFGASFIAWYKRKVLLM